MHSISTLIAAILAPAAMSMTTEELGKYMREDIEKWARIVKISGAKADQ